MSLERQLNRWIRVGLIDPDQAQRIRTFERDESRPVFLVAIAGLAAAAISIGLVAIVAANWEQIPGRVKIAVDLVLLIGLAVAMLRWSDHPPHRLWIRETAIVVFYGAVLASIALVGQVYQLGGRSHEALGLWTALTALLMLQARSSFAAWLWIIGLQVTYGVWLAWAADGPWDLDSLALSAIYWAPLACLVLAGLASVRRRRSALAHALASVGWAELVLCASVGTFAFYEDTRGDDWGGLWIGLLGSCLVTAWLWTRFQPRSNRGARWLLLACLVLAHVPLLTSPGDLEVLAALAFIGLWVLVAWVANENGSSRLMGLATAVVGIRLVAIYFEVFGDLLGTGAGLVTGGLLTLSLVAWWVRRGRRLAIANPPSTGKGNLS